MPIHHQVSLEELHKQLESFKAFFYLHAYQPPRKFTVKDQQIFDISGESDIEGGYNEKVYQRCYLPMSQPIPQEGVENPTPLLDHPLITGHLFGVTRDWIKTTHAHTWQFIQKVMQDSPIPFLDPYLHPIFPLLPDQAQALLVDIGIRAWQMDMDRQVINAHGKPQTGFGFWLPELAVTHRTVEILAQKGVRFLVLDQAQIEADNYSPVYQVTTKHGPVFVFAYNGKEFARKVAFEPIVKAETFAKAIYKYFDSVHRPPFAAMDMETFGEWRGQESLWFLNFLVHNLLDPQAFSRTKDMIQVGKIKDYSSWSCDCGLGRWDGSQSCCEETPHLIDLKKHLYTGLRTKLDQTLLDLNHQQPGWEEKFVNYFVNNREALGNGSSLNFESLNSELQLSFEKLIVNLVGMTSCGWFYSNSEIERQIPVNCLEYLEKLG